MVFENLLAMHNPETGKTARKETGSYYTPRAIVNYMVEETLIAALAAKLHAARPAVKQIEERLRHLFAYTAENHRFTDDEVSNLVSAIDGLKVLDPACGSGAFPMGVLHRLVFVLGKLDPHNKLWMRTQLEKLVDAALVSYRNDAEVGVTRAFGEGEADYARKLFLIQNCIYGVDIQAIAVQISKLRCFISLVVDQRQSDDLTANRGIRPLPNLESNFVAADSLLGVERPGQQHIRTVDLDIKKAELRLVREKHFLAPTYQVKERLRAKDEKLRSELALLLVKNDWDTITAAKLANWNPYDQIASAPFFDSEWMLGVSNGFDIVLGNPPYLNVELVTREMKDCYAQHFKTMYKRFDVFGLFYEQALTRFSAAGQVAFIVPSQIFNNLSYKKLRTLMLSSKRLWEVLYLGDEVFKAANNDVCVLFLGVPKTSKIRLVDALDFDHPKVTEVEQDYFERFGGVISVCSNDAGDSVATKVFRPGFEKVRKHWEVFQGIVTGNNAAYILTPSQAKSAKLEPELLHQVLRGRDFEKWRIRESERLVLYANAQTDLKKYPHAQKWLTPHRSMLEKRREVRRKVIPWYSLQWPRDQNLLDCRPKVLVQRTRNPRLASRIVAALDTKGVYAMESVIILAPKAHNENVRALLALLNSSLVNYIFRTRFLNVAVKAEYLKDLPLPAMSEQQESTLTSFADKTLAGRAAGRDTAAAENEIDRIVYDLYGLTKDEIAIVEGRAK